MTSTVMVCMAQLGMQTVRMKTPRNNRQDTMIMLNEIGDLLYQNFAYIPPNAASLAHVADYKGYKMQFYPSLLLPTNFKFVIDMWPERRRSLLTIRPKQRRCERK